MNKVAELKMDVEEKAQKRSELVRELANLRTQMGNFEVDPDDYEEQYDDMLDEVHGLIMNSYAASTVLKEVDPTAYRCGLLDYVDGVDVESDEKYISLSEERDEVESEIEDLDSEIADLNKQVNELKEGVAL